MADKTCLAEGMVFPADFKLTGVNLNELIVGSTGSGKSVSINEARLLHTTESSLVVPIAKKALREKYAKIFEDRGYKVINLDFAHPENSTVGYDPMDYIHSEQDVVQTARNLIGLEESKARDGGSDPYWNDSATSVLAAVIALVRITAEECGIKPSFADVIKIYQSMELDTSRATVHTSLDRRFEELGCEYPHNQASELWKTVAGLGSKTASCIFSIVNNSLDKIFSKNVIDIMRKDEMLSFKDFGNEKTILFITTSPMNRTLGSFINLMYADMFRELFENAESRDTGALNIPVHIICDDFACTGRIADFENYISIFRAANISVTILLQSESQLNSMYGQGAAATIINNCDTYVYMGGMDVETCRNLSYKINKNVKAILALPLEQVIVFRRGMEPVVARRYQTYEDSLYKSLMVDDERK